MLALAVAFMPEAPGAISSGAPGPPSNIYLRPGGVFNYFRPDGTSYYIRP